MTTILSSNLIVENSISELNKKSLALTKVGIFPHLVIILVGNDPASMVYVKNKILFGEKVGVKVTLKKFDENISDIELKNEISKNNLDENIHGIIIQLPLPKKFNSMEFLNLITPSKDVDCLSPQNLKNFYYKLDLNNLIPCTPKGILKLLKEFNIEIAKKNIVIIGRSNIVGKPLSVLLENLNATVTLCHSYTKDIKFFTLNADIIISAIGKPKFFTSEFFKNDKSQIVIDVGMNKLPNQKLSGDVDFDNVKDQVKAITPVPGGIGRLTVLSLIENVILNAGKKANT
jgi:methylenetetrahydrofolate dehydrogenase (NADP+)/methenyltetrahydrofolate cyclohydrolase